MLHTSSFVVSRGSRLSNAMNGAAKPFVIVVGGVLALVIVGRAVLGHDRPKPVPGIKYSPWRSQREKAPPPGSGFDASKKIYVRAGRRYMGPPPSDGQLALYRAKGDCDALMHWLREPWSSQVRAAVADLEEALNAISDACDQAIEDAKQRIRGTEEEYLRKDPQSIEPGLRAFLDRAQKEKDMCVSDSFDGGMREYRIRKTAHPRVFELRTQETEVNELRRRTLHDEVAALLDREGREVLDEAAMQRAWDALLDRVDQ